MHVDKIPLQQYQSQTALIPHYI